MYNNQPTTARALLGEMRRTEYRFQTQDPSKGADFDKLMAQSQNESWEEIEKRRARIFAMTGKPPQIFGKDIN